MTRTAYLFPGQGSQKQPKNSSVVEETQKILGFNPFEADKINLTAYAQPAILSYSLDILKSLSYRPDYLVGHSLGEYTALVAGGVLTFQDALQAVHYRGQVMQETVPVGAGGMLVVLGEDADKLAWLCKQVSGYVTVANYNGPTQTVLSGNTEGLLAIQAKLKTEGIRKILPLPVSAPFHCELMKPAQEKLANYLCKLNFQDSKIPIISNVHAEPVVSGLRLRELLIQQVTAPVQFTKIIEFLKKSGIQELIEVGPGKSLMNLVKRIDPNFILKSGEEHAVSK